MAAATKKGRMSKLSLSRSMADMTNGHDPGMTHPIPGPNKHAHLREANLSPTSVLPEYVSTDVDVDDALNFLFPM